MTGRPEVRDATGRRPTHGPGTGGGNYPNSDEERQAAALVCKDRAVSEDDLGELLAALGLAR